MGLQSQIIQEYEFFFGKRTFQQIASHTGIQITRVFRLHNGSLMRLDEYERFRKLIDERRQVVNQAPLANSIDSLISSVDWEGRKKIEMIIARYLSKKKIKANHRCESEVG